MYFEIYREGSKGGLFGSGTSGQWRWRLKAGNHEPISSGESYVSKAGCLHAIALIQSTTMLTPIKEV